MGCVPLPSDNEYSGKARESLIPWNSEIMENADCFDEEFNKSFHPWQEAFRVIARRGNRVKFDKKINYSLRRPAGCVTPKRKFIYGLFQPE